MEVALGKKLKGAGQEGKPDIYEMVARMMVTMSLKFLARKLKEKSKLNPYAFKFRIEIEYHV